MTRFVILKHQTPSGHDWPTHWDFMIEEGNALLTWALAHEPQIGRSVHARQLANHRKQYLEYEGPVSGKRGSVSRWDFGTYTVVAWAAGRLHLSLDGQQLRCHVVLVQERDEDQRWTVTFSEGTRPVVSPGSTT